MRVVIYNTWLFTVVFPKNRTPSTFYDGCIKLQEGSEQVVSTERRFEHLRLGMGYDNDGPKLLVIAIIYI
jgi:hypothetical protein